MTSSGYPTTSQSGRPLRTVSFAQLQLSAQTPVILEICKDSSTDLEPGWCRLVGELVSKTLHRLAVHLGNAYLDRYVEKRPIRVIVPHRRYGVLAFQALSVVVYRPLVWIDAPTDVMIDRALRVPYPGTVAVEVENCYFRCTVANLSASGICVRLPYDSATSLLHDVGAICRIDLGSHAPFGMLTAKLVWRKGEMAGLSFIGLSSYEQGELLTYTTDIAARKARVERQLAVR